MTDSMRIKQCFQYLFAMYVALIDQIEPERANSVFEVAKKAVPGTSEDQQQIEAVLFAMLIKELPENERAQTFPETSATDMKLLEEAPTIWNTIRNLEVTEHLFAGFMIGCLTRAGSDPSVAPDQMVSLVSFAKDFAKEHGCSLEEISEACTPFIHGVIAASEQQGDSAS